MAYVELQTQQDDIVYIESSLPNEILISYTSDVVLGLMSSIDYDIYGYLTKVTKTGGLALLTNLVAGDAIKINNEVKRVDYIEDDDTFYTTKPFRDSHVATDTIYKDFSNNISTISSSVGNVYNLANDNFENQVAISDLIGGLLSIKGCSEFSNATSLFIFDDNENPKEREESFITGTYNLDTQDLDNIVNPFLAKIGRQLYYIVDMVQSEYDLDDDGMATIVEGLNPNIYSVRLNGNFIDNSKYSILGNTITVNSQYLRGNFNYVQILHFPNQEDYIIDNNIAIRLNINNYDKLFMLDTDDLSDLYHMNIRDNFSSQVSYGFYDIENKSIKQKSQEKIDISSTLTITTKIGENSEDNKLVQRHLQAYLQNLDKFRIIRKIDDTGSYEYHNNCRLNQGSTFTEGDTNTYTYTIEFLQRVLILPNTLGSKKLGEFYLGVDKAAIE